MVRGPLPVITSDPGDDAFRILANALVAFTISSKIRIAHRGLGDYRTFIRLVLTASELSDRATPRGLVADNRPSIVI
jgi:hypothetical protein